MTTVKRVPIYQLESGNHIVVTEAELGNNISSPSWIVHVRWCIGALWAEKTQPDMVAIHRYHTPSRSAYRLGVEGTAHNWHDYVQGPLLGYAFPAGARPGSADLVDVNAYSGQPEGSYAYWNGIEEYPGFTPPETHAPRAIVPGEGFRCHAPTIVRVSYDPGTQNLTVTPDVAEVNLGTGAPIVWLRGNGLSPDGQTWSFAYLSFNWHNTRPTSGNTFIQEAQFVNRHVTPGQMIVVDNYDAATREQDFEYRISILDHATNEVVTRDPKVRNGSAAGSGGG